MKFTIGTDPEIFVLRSTNLISAAGLVPGDKKAPYKVPNGAIQVDGTALEFNINPTDMEDEFLFNVKSVMGSMLDQAKLKFNDVVPYIEPIVKFGDEEWSKTPPDAKILGCDPDFSAVDGMINPNPGDVLLNLPVRTASGHIHIGWTSGKEASDASHFGDCLSVAKFFHEAGVFAPKTSGEKSRLKYYGMNGSFRPKPYGVELRAPSNLWLRSDKGIRDIFRLTYDNFKAFAGA